MSDTSDLWRPRALREYSFIADGERGALIGPAGAIVWLCAPRWNSQAVFSSLVGGRGGYAVTPQDPWHVWGGSYEPGTLIWHSRWVGSGVVECREAMAMPADQDRAVVLRRIEAKEGPAHVRVVLDLRAGFGASKVRDLGKRDGIWAGRSGSAGRTRGHDVEAAHWFERNQAACGPAGLYTEEYDVHQRQLRGNLPQAFVHAAMLECAVRLSGFASIGGEGAAGGQ